MLRGWWRDAAWSEKSTKRQKTRQNNKTKEVSKYCALIHWLLMMDDWLFWLTGSWRIRISCRSDCCCCISHFYKSAFMGLSRDIWEPIQPSAAKRKSNRCLTMVITITVIGANWHHYYILFGKWPPWLFFVRQLIPNVEALSAVSYCNIEYYQFY